MLEQQAESDQQLPVQQQQPAVRVWTPLVAVTSIIGGGNATAGNETETTILAPEGSVIEQPRPGVVRVVAPTTTVTTTQDGTETTVSGGGMVTVSVQGGERAGGAGMVAAGASGSGADSPTDASATTTQRNRKLLEEEEASGAVVDSSTTQRQHHQRSLRVISSPLLVPRRRTVLPSAGLFTSPILPVGTGTTLLPGGGLAGGTTIVTSTPGFISTPTLLPGGAIAAASSTATGGTGFLRSPFVGGGGLLGRKLQQVVVGGRFGPGVSGGVGRRFGTGAVIRERGVRPGFAVTGPALGARRSPSALFGGPGRRVVPGLGRGVALVGRRLQQTPVFVTGGGPGGQPRAVEATRSGGVVAVGPDPNTGSRRNPGALFGGPGRAVYPGLGPRSGVVTVG